MAKQACFILQQSGYMEMEDDPVGGEVTVADFTSDTALPVPGRIFLRIGRVPVSLIVGLCVGG